jgi:Tfp pilus assembly protein PilV
MNIIRRQYGFMLTDVLVGLVIFSIGLLGAARLIVSISQNNTFSQHLTTATTLAQDQIAAVQRLGYANADSAAGTEDHGDIVNYSAYKRVTTVSPSTPTAGIKMVSVAVSWQSKSGTHTVTAPTLLAR